MALSGESDSCLDPVGIKPFPTPLGGIQQHLLDGGKKMTKKNTRGVWNWFKRNCESSGVGVKLKIEYF